MKEVYVQLEEENQSLRRKTLVQEKELRRHRNALTESTNKIAVLQKKLKVKCFVLSIPVSQAVIPTQM